MSKEGAMGGIQGFKDEGEAKFNFLAWNNLCVLLCIFNR
jgi:hypothetical protein